MKWFKHESDARNSLKLRKVRRRYGADGYAIYWFCLEAIAYEIDKDNLTFDLKDDAETIAFELSVQEKRVEEIMHYLVEVGLFESSQGIVTCLKLAERLDKSMTNSPKMRSWLDSKSVMTSADGVMTNADSVKTCPELDKIRLDKTILNNNDRSNDQSKVVQEAFEWFWSTAWKPTKKLIGKVDTSPKSFNLEKRWKPLFNKKYFMTHTTEKFKAEINAMATFCKEAHNADRGRFENMQLARFLSEKQWRDL